MDHGMIYVRRPTAHTTLSDVKRTVRTPKVALLIAQFALIIQHQQEY
jgi:hypothetical protein